MSVLWTLALMPTSADGTNRIVLENQLPGSPYTEWDVNGAGTQDIQGFATRNSVEVGETVSFKIKLASPEPFRVDVYRLGYYGGAGARKIGTAKLRGGANKVAARQPRCHTDDSTQLMDCGNWGVIATFELPDNATTGLYFARATLLNPNDNWRADDSRLKYDPHHAVAGRDPSLPPESSLPHAYSAAGKNRLRNALTLPRASHIWFVVRDPPATGALPDRGLLFQTADLTWHAYNGYGGYTTYGSFEYPREHAPFRTMMNVSQPGHELRRAYKRSFNTPLITRDYRAVNMRAAAPANAPGATPPPLASRPLATLPPLTAPRPRRAPPAPQAPLGRVSCHPLPRAQRLRPALLRGRRPGHAARRRAARALDRLPLGRPR
jgi:hypothetical protein